MYNDVKSGHVSLFCYVLKISWNYGKAKKEEVKLCTGLYVSVLLCFLGVLIFVDVKYIKKEIWGFIEIHGFIFEVVGLNEEKINTIYFLQMADSFIIDQEIRRK